MPRDLSPSDRHDPDRLENIDLREADPYRSSGLRIPRAREPRDCDREAGAQIPPDAGRTVLYDRERAYRVSLAQVHALRDLAKFRVIAVHDLTEFVYRNCEERAVPEFRHLLDQGLLSRSIFRGPEGLPREFATLTSRGHRLVCANALVPPGQCTYSGFVRSKGASHDADLYRIYQEEAAQIENKGGEPLRVVLHYELNRNINGELARYGRSARPEIAARHGLSVVGGKIPLPDLQIEYATREGDIERVSLELVTEHYRGHRAGEKARAGFKLYTPHGEADRLRRVLDRHELTADILSL
jgi:hypothetical protein